MPKSEEPRLRVLRRAVRHPDGICDVDGVNGLQRAQSRKLMGRMAEEGLLEPSPHQDWYVTDAGRRFLAEREAVPRGD